MCCEHQGHHAGRHRMHHRGGSCGCGGHFYSGPCFSTREEKAAWLERNLAGLQEQVKMVEERIAVLRGNE
jgi:hypothetical protein